MTPHQRLRLRLWMRRVALLVVVVAGAVTIHLSTRPEVPAQFTAAQTRTFKMLQKRLPDLTFDRTPLREALARLSDLAGVRMSVDADALSAAGLSVDAPVSARLRDVRLQKALELLAAQVGLVRRCRDDGSVDLLTPAQNDAEAGWREYDLRPYVTPLGAPDPDWSDPHVIKLQEDIVNLIQETIGPESWKEAGGRVGTCTFERGTLRVLQHPDEQWLIAHLLDQLLNREAAMQYLYERLTGARP
jgi:hypothetical protein